MPPGDSQMAGRRPEVAFQGVNQCSRASGPKPRPGPATPKVLKQVASFVRKATSCPRHMFDMALGYSMQVGHGGSWLQFYWKGLNQTAYPAGPDSDVLAAGAAPGLCHQAFFTIVNMAFRLASSAICWMALNPGRPLSDSSMAPSQLAT